MARKPFAELRYTLRKAALATGLLGLGTLSQAMTINATFDSSITGAANAAQIEGAIDQAVSFYGQTLADPGSVSILFSQTASSSFLGQSQVALESFSYGTFSQLLASDAASHPGNTTLASAVTNLGSGNQAPAIVTSTADARALGLHVQGTLGAGGATGTGNFDGIVTLSSLANWGFDGNVASGQYDIRGVIQHEVNEVLGVGGAGSQLTASGLSNANYIGALDLYRYAAPGVPSLTASTSAKAYFSVDGGATVIRAFNQSGQGDYGDWDVAGACGRDVQSEAACTGVNAVMTPLSPEMLALQAVGYEVSPSAVPEPAAVSLWLLGGMALGWAVRRVKT